MKNYMNGFKGFREDVEKALKGVAKQYGIDFHCGNIKYDATSFTVQLKATRNDVDVQKQNFIANCKYVKGFTENDYLAEIQHHNRTYQIVGFKPGCKYNVIVKRDDGHEYGFQSAYILQLLNRKTA